MTAGASDICVLFLCTGNATRSVLAGASLDAHGLLGVEVATAGTLTVDHQPMSVRTRAAFEAIGLPVPVHRSRQVSGPDLDRADLVVGLAPEHVHWVRRQHPAAAVKTATLKRLVVELPRHRGDLRARVSSLQLDRIEIETWEEVVDPGGGDVAEFVACAREIQPLIGRLASVMRSLGGAAPARGEGVEPQAKPGV